MNSETIGIIAGVLALVAFIPYIISVIKGKTNPNITTWWIWSFIGVLLCLSHYKTIHSLNSLWVPISYALGPIAVAILSIKYGNREFGWLERFCVLISALGFILWMYTTSPILALIYNLVIDFLGSLPTFRKAYNEPHTEDFKAWILFSVANMLNLFTVSHWNSAEFVYPIYLFTISGVVTSVLLLRRRFT